MSGIVCSSLFQTAKRRGGKNPFNAFPGKVLRKLVCKVFIEPPDCMGVVNEAFTMSFFLLQKEVLEE